MKARIDLQQNVEKEMAETLIGGKNELKDYDTFELYQELKDFMCMSIRNMEIISDRNCGFHKVTISTSIGAA